MGAHEDQPLLQQGPEFRDAGGLLILLHGRDATARDIMTLVPQLEHEGLAFAAPQADGKSWFPYSFLVPVQQNEPGIPSAMTVIRSLVTEADLLGVPNGKVMVLGFDQGACLALEFAARNPARYGAIFALSGGLIGPPGTTWESQESLSGTPVFIGYSDVDPHIHRSRVEESGEVLTRLGAVVKLKLYSGMGHTISGEELEHVNSVIADVLAAPATS
ncbi:MAG: dienelactone hydrolase family protein [Spirochaetales bacterium]|nr:dienelactone hydrolase family protein [Spirochaetales bacterium]